MSDSFIQHRRFPCGYSLTFPTRPPSTSLSICATANPSTCCIIPSGADWQQWSLAAATLVQLLQFWDKGGITVTGSLCTVPFFLSALHPSIISFIQSAVVTQCQTPPLRPPPHHHTCTDTRYASTFVSNDMRTFSHLCVFGSLWYSDTWNL